MRASPIMLVALVLAGGATAQPDSASLARQNEIAAQMEGQRQQALAAEREAFAAEQRAQTNQSLADLAAARAGQPSPPRAVVPPASAGLAARADAIARLTLEAMTRTVILRPAARNGSPP